LKRIIRNIIILFFLGLSSTSFTQEQELFDLIVADENATPPLLPERMIFTQKILWGEKGLMRKTGISPLTVQNREKELRLRRSFLKTHQILGYTTLATMIAQGIIGGKLYNGQNNLYDTHKTMGKIVNVGYFTGAALSLFSPPPLTNKKTKGFSSIKAHKILANIHFSAMVITNVVADDNKKAHRAAAYTAFASYATAVIVFKF
tara:strand:- start:2646 stop:3257 length:612 start_codon:yes stop_codon:yes gene_type:complete